MSTKIKPKVKDSPSRPQKQYYRRILNAIDNIEMVLLDKLNCSSLIGTKQQHKNNRAQTPVNSQRTVRMGTPQSEKVNKKRVVT